MSRISSGLFGHSRSLSLSLVLWTILSCVHLGASIGLLVSACFRYRESVRMSEQIDQLLQKHSQTLKCSEELPKGYETPYISCPHRLPLTVDSQYRKGNGSHKPRQSVNDLSGIRSETLNPVRYGGAVKNGTYSTDRKHFLALSQIVDSCQDYGRGFSFGRISGLTWAVRVIDEILETHERL